MLGEENLRVYPRVCGGTFRAFPQRNDHVRFKVYPRVCGGTLSVGSHGRLLKRMRSIPACAGEPFEDVKPAAVYWPVYPRVCGGTCAERPTLCIRG